MTTVVQLPSIGIVTLFIPEVAQKAKIISGCICHKAYTTFPESSRDKGYLVEIISNLNYPIESGSIMKCSKELG